jgi:hypothetical protein
VRQDWTARDMIFNYRKPMLPKRPLIHSQNRSSTLCFDELDEIGYFVQIMAASADAKIDEAQLLEDQTADKKVIFRLLSKFDLSIGDVAEIFATYLLKHPAEAKDLDRLKLALKLGATERQARIVAVAGPLLTSEKVAELLGYKGRQTTNNKKQSGQLFAISFSNRRGDFFPAFQFDGSQVRSWIPELLKRIPNEWSALAFLTAKYESLEGKSWLDILGADPSRADELLAAADAYVS